MNIPKGVTLFCTIMCFVMAGLDAIAGQYIWTVIMAGIGVWNYNIYQKKVAEEEGAEKETPAGYMAKPSCPPHEWGIKAGLLHCGKCHCDLQGRKKK